MAYYSQSAIGHLQIMLSARRIDSWLASGQIPSQLKQRLETAQQIRCFASTRLGLPDNDSYRSYAELDRPFAVWTVVAAPELSLALRQWCYPVVGCVSYRGYYSEQAAHRMADSLQTAGLDTTVTGVAAYSTLGWFNDPLLDTFLFAPDPQLAKIVFHELAHQRLYVAGDTTFSESFAVAVERAGVRLWLQTHGNDATRKRYDQYLRRQADFSTLLIDTRQTLSAVYRAATSDAWKRQQKQRILQEMELKYGQLKADRWHGYQGYDRFFDPEVNNAKLALAASYSDFVPAFEYMIAAVDGDLPRFYAQATVLSDLPVQKRHAKLQAMLSDRGSIQSWR